MLIATGILNPEVLERRVVVMSGAGSGIGFEAARSLLWLGAKVVIAEIDASTGRAAAATLHDQSPQAMSSSSRPMSAAPSPSTTWLRR